MKIRSRHYWTRLDDGLARPLVFTNGVFDILHRGHVEYLHHARANGASLFVGLNNDSSASRLGKGDGRPVNGLEDRMVVIAGLGCVDAVTWFDEDTPANLIELLKPDVLVKAADWTEDQIVGGAETRARGGAVVIAPHLRNYSTTALIERIKKLR